MPKRSLFMKVRRPVTPGKTIAAAALAMLLLSAAPAIAQAPVIANILPSSAPVGGTVVIVGQNFGSETEASSVTFNGVKADPTLWTNGFILTTVPEGASTGPVLVTTEAGPGNPFDFEVTGSPLPGAPKIDSLFPTQGPVGTPVAITGSNFGDVQLNSRVTFSGVEATTIAAWSDTNIVALVPEGARTGPVVVRTALGASNGVQFTVTTAGLYTWYLAEGSTAWGFDTYVLMENTVGTEAVVTVTYNTTQYGRIPRPVAITIPPESRLTLHLNDEIPDVDLSTMITSSQPIVCERAMYWNDRLEGHESIGVTEPARKWYLAEGSTNHGFETWLLLQNPGVLDATVQVTYQTTGGVVLKSPLTVEAGERVTVEVARDVGACDVSAEVTSNRDIICERAMYWDGRRGGHDSIGVTAPARRWYLAEGSTAWGFETWLLLQNPGESSTDVSVEYMTPSGPIGQPVFGMGPNSRKTIRVRDYVKNSDTSIKVSATSGVIAERSMYWDNGTGKAGHGTVGVNAPARSVFLAEGSTAWGFETFVCVQNPNNEAAEVQFVYLTDSGAVLGPSRMIPARSRLTEDVNQDLPNRDTSIKVTSRVPIMAERAMYWHEKGAGHSSIGYMGR